MKKLKRNMTKVEPTENENSICNDFLIRSQASFNSDGCMTIRNYNVRNKDEDEIIIFNQRETEAIFTLFNWFKNHDLPF